MKRLIRAVAANSATSLFVFAIVTLVALVVAVRLPIDAVPDLTNVQVQIVTRAPTLSGAEVETQITQPIERAMAGTPGLVQTRSITKLGISIITLVFKDGTDTYFARAQVNERLASVRDSIAEDVGRPELAPVTTALGEIYMFELRPNEKSPRSNEELRTIVEWQIAPKLRQVSGVVDVVGFGGTLKQYRVTLDPARLAAHGISAQEARAVLTRDNRVAGGGFVEADSEQVVLRGDARFRGIEDIADTVIRTDARGAPLRIGQVADVDTGPALRQGAMSRDGRGEIVGASVYLLRGQNSRDVVANVKKAIADLEPQLPEGLHIESYYDRAEFIDNVLGTITKNLSEGAIIVVLCLLLTLGSLRAGLLVAGTLPFAMLTGFVGLYAVGESGNAMSLGAVDFGILVEGVVVGIEHAMTHAAAIDDRKRRQQAIVDALGEVARPAVFGTLITLLVFLPLAALEDVEGKMFRPVVFSLCFMLVGALVYAFVLVPAVAPKVLIWRGKHAEPIFARWLSRLYEPALAWSLLHPKRTLAAAFAITLGLVASGTNLGADFLPRVFEGAFAIDALRPPSVSLPQAVALTTETERALREIPEVETVVSRTGRPEGAVDPAGPESSDVFVILKPRSAWRHGLTPVALAEEVDKKLSASVPATINALSQPIEMRVNDLVTGAKGDVAIKIFGDDLATMSDVAERVRRVIADIPGAADVKTEATTGLPSIVANVDRLRAGRVGVAPSDVLDAVSMAKAGVQVGEVREGERVFDLVLRLGGDGVTSRSDIARLPVTLANGGWVPVSSVADVSEQPTVVQIGREQLRRRLLVQANVRGRDMVGFVAEAQSRVAKLELPKSIEIVWGGQFQGFLRAKKRLSFLVPISLGIVAILLTSAFKRGALTLVTMLNLPFALAGGIAALALRGMPFSIPAAVGFIAVTGVSVMTGLVMTTQLLSRPRSESVADRVRAAAKHSLRSIVSTGLIAAVGFVPAAIATGTGAEVQRPLATVVIGGLIASLALSLFALPSMLLLAARKMTFEPLSDDSPTDVAPLAHVSKAAE
jgi:cobalt-zinc-cadmium resistance protein CzcA